MVLGSGTLATGCTNGPGRRGEKGRKSSDNVGGPAKPDPDIALATAALAGERAALEALEATIASHRGSRGALRPIVEAHRAHISLLAQAARDDSPAPTPSRPDNSSAPFRVPGTARKALARLAAEERALSTAAKRRAFTAQSGAFARLLASMAAAAGQHAVLLDEKSSATASKS